MKLSNLTIELVPSWQDENAGRYVAKMTWDDSNQQSVKVVLDPTVSETLLAFIGPVITQFSHQAALKMEEAITLSVAEARQLPVIEDKKEVAA